jgi:hypothetical protein
MIETLDLKVESLVTCFSPFGYHRVNVLWQNCHTVFLKLKYVSVIYLDVHSSTVLVRDILLIPFFLCGAHVMRFYVWPYVWLYDVFIHAVIMCFFGIRSPAVVVATG